MTTTHTARRRRPNVPTSAHRAGHRTGSRIGATSSRRRCGDARRRREGSRRARSSRCASQDGRAGIDRGLSSVSWRRRCSRPRTSASSQGSRTPKCDVGARVRARRCRTRGARARRAEPRHADRVPKLVNVVDEMCKTKRACKDELAKKLASHAKEAAARAARARSRSRAHRWGRARALSRARVRDRRRQIDEMSIEGACARGPAYLDELRQAYRDAAEPARRVRAREPASRRHDGAAVRSRRHAARRSDPGGSLGLDARVARFELPPRPAVQRRTRAGGFATRLVARSPTRHARPHPGRTCSRHSSSSRKFASTWSAAGRRRRHRSWRRPRACRREARTRCIATSSASRVARPAGPRRRRCSLRHDGRSGHRGSIRRGRSAATQTLTSKTDESCATCHRLGRRLTKRFGLGDDEERTFREIGNQYHLSRDGPRDPESALDKLNARSSASTRPRRDVTGDTVGS